MKKVLFVVATLFSFLAVFILLPQEVHAEGEPTNRYPEPSYACVYANTGDPCAQNMIYLSVGFGEHISGKTSVEVYVTGTGSKTVTIDIIRATTCYASIPGGGGTQDVIPSANFFFDTRYSVEDTGGNVVSRYGFPVTNGVMTVGYDCNVQDRQISFTGIGGQTYYFIADVDYNNTSGENLFRLQATNATLGAGENGKGGISLSNRDIPKDYEITYTMFFGTDCNTGVIGDTGILFKDADKGIYQGVGSYPDLYVALLEKPKTSSNGWVNITGGRHLLTGGDKGDDIIEGVSFKPDYDYRLNIFSLTRPNALEILLHDSFSQINVGKPCKVVSGNLSCTATSSSNIRLDYNWLDNSGTIRLRRGTTSSGTELASSAAGSSPGSVYNDGGRAANTTYSYSLWSDGTLLSTASCTTFHVRNATCTFINTPASANVGQSFTVQVRVNNLSSSTANISGSTQPVTTARVSGPSATGMPSTNNSYASISPGTSQDLPGISVTASSAGTLSIRATISGVNNSNNTCNRNITINNVRNAVCSFINTPTNAFVGQTITYQVRITNLPSSTTSISGSTNAVQVGPRQPAGYIPTNQIVLVAPTAGTWDWIHGGYSSISPGSSSDLAVISFKILSTGIAKLRGDVQNVNNDGSDQCERDITVTYPNPEAHCTVAPVNGVLQLGKSDNPVTLTVWFTMPAYVPAPPSANVTAASTNINGTINGTLNPPPALPSNMNEGVINSEDLNFLIASPASAGAATLNGSVTFSTDNGLGIGVNVTGSDTCTDAVDVGNIPYFKAFAGDVFAGGKFEYENCLDTSTIEAGVFGFPEDGSLGGSSVQLSIDSLMNINGVYSASQRASGSVLNDVSFPLSGTTIANTSGTYGTGSGNVRCLGDYFNTTRDPEIDQGEYLGGNPALNGRTQYWMPGGSTFTGLLLNKAKQMAIYVDGDLTISGNITYNQTANRNKFEDIPKLVIIVKGNIYITDNVTELNGTFVAQPHNDGSHGKIYTCANVGAAKPDANIYNECQNPLTVYGSLVAKTIRFLRMKGTFDSAVPGEYPNASYPSYYNNVAETLILSPESYLAPSPLQYPGAPQGYTDEFQWDAAAGLPPVF